jgi:hypothetical protein
LLVHSSRQHARGLAREGQLGGSVIRGIIKGRKARRHGSHGDDDQGERVPLATFREGEQRV